MNNFGTVTKTGVKTSTKVAVGLLALGSVVAGLVMLQKRGFMNNKLVPSPSTTTPTSTTSTIGATVPSSPTTPTLPACTDGNWTSVDTTRACPASGVKVVNWIKKGDCEGGVVHTSTESVPCSNTGASGPQPTPTTSTSSTLSTTPVCTEADWTSSVTPRVCPNSGRQTRTWIKTGNCVNGVRHVSSETIYCVAGM